MANTQLDLFAGKSDYEIITETDGLWVQLINLLHNDPAFNAALDKGELTDGAIASISTAFDAAFDRNRRLANIFMADLEARKEITKFWFARAFAETQATAAYAKAFRQAREV